MPQTRVPWARLPAFTSGTRQEQTSIMQGTAFFIVGTTQLCALAWCWALWCRVLLGSVLSPHFLLASAAVFAFWGGVSSGAVRHAAIPRAGCSCLLPAE